MIGPADHKPVRPASVAFGGGSGGGSLSLTPNRTERDRDHDDVKKERTPQRDVAAKDKENTNLQQGERRSVLWLRRTRLTLLYAENVEFVLAEHDYVAENGDELSFKAGDMVRLISRTCEDEGWWRGELNGKQGVFPDNFGNVISGPSSLNGTEAS